MMPPTHRLSSVTSHMVHPRAPFFIARMRASVWVVEKLVGKKKTSEREHPATAGGGGCLPCMPEGVLMMMVGTALTATAAPASASATQILLVSVRMTTFSPGLTPPHCMALSAPRIISMKLEDPGM